MTFRRGIALLSVLAALVLLGALAAGVALEALRLQRAARRALAAHAAAAAVESAVHERIATWPVEAAWLARGAEWRDSTRHTRPLDVPVAIDLRIVRLSATAYRVIASAVASSDENRIAARRSAGRIVSLRAPELTPPAAVLTFGRPALADLPVLEPAITGRDTLLDGWECDPADTAGVAGLALPVAEIFEPPPGTMEGAPPLLALAGDSIRAFVDALDSRLDSVNEAAGDSKRALAASLQLHDSTLHAPFVAPAVDEQGACDGQAPLNWGDPLRLTRCADARPLTWIRGSLILPRGRSQGVLVVDGDVELGGGFSHHGIVLIRGFVRRADVPIADPDAIVGMLVLSQPSSAGHDIRSLRVRYSSCVVRTALRAIGHAVPASGGWREGW